MSGTKKPRPQLPKISEEMKVWSAMLATEMAGWPSVTTRPMFGLTAFYRKGVIFAVLPKTRGMNSSSSLAFKIPAASPRVLARLQRDAHIQETEMQAAKWFSLEMKTDGNLRNALEWLGEAYEVAGKKGKA